MGDLWSAIAQYGIGPVVIGVILYLLIFWQNKRAESKRKKDEDAESGRIEINLATDNLRTTLTDGEQQRSLNSYSVVGKVLAADLINTDKFQNHFLLTAAALGPQMLKTYDLGLDSNGKPAVLTTERIREFFFDILQGRITVQNLDGSFSIDQFARTM
jgi:hypothetical protein